VAGAGAEVIVVDNSTDVMYTTTYSVREYCGERATNNYAEYKGLLVGLRQAKSCIEQNACTQSLSKRPLFRLQVYGDSNLIVQQLRGAWQCKHPNIVPLFQESQSLIREIQKYDTRSVVAFDHVYREHNKVADGERVHRRILFCSSFSVYTVATSSNNLRCNLPTNANSSGK
jgi:ribonuclease HI